MEKKKEKAIGPSIDVKLKERKKERWVEYL